MTDAPLPDTNAALLQLDMQRRNAGGGATGIFGIPDVNVGSGLTAQGLMGKNIPALFASGTGNGKAASAFWAAIQAIPEEMRKRAAEAGVVYSGDLPSGSVHSSGGGFAASSGGRNDDIGIG